MVTILLFLKYGVKYCVGLLLYSWSIWLNTAQLSENVGNCRPESGSKIPHPHLVCCLKQLLWWEINTGRNELRQQFTLKQSSAKAHDKICTVKRGIKFINIRFPFTFNTFLLTPIRSHHCFLSEGKSITEVWGPLRIFSSSNPFFFHPFPSLAPC